MTYKLKACGKCNGDLLLDGDEWRCCQCGTYFYPQEALSDVLLEFRGAQESRLVLQPFEREFKSHRVGARRRKMTNINLVISANERSENRWKIRNQIIIDRLKQGYNVRQISEMVGKDQRQIRDVKSRLEDLVQEA